MKDKTDRKDEFLISRVSKEFKKKFYDKCAELGIRPSDKLREMTEKFLK